MNRIKKNRMTARCTPVLRRNTADDGRLRTDEGTRSITDAVENVPAMRVRVLAAVYQVWDCPEGMDRCCTL